MKVLIIGGTGTIGQKITALAALKGYECSIFTRGLKNIDIPNEIEVIKGDRYDPESLKKAICKKYYDVVVDQTCFNVEQAKTLVDSIGDKMNQLVFTSTACVYNRPFSSLPVTEDCDTSPTIEFPYGYNKRQAELYLLDNMAKGGPNVTIIRPSHTIGEGKFIGFLYSDYSLIYRLKNRKPIICPGDGQSIWTLTYTSDIATGYVGTFGNEKTYGQVYHMTTDEYHTWEDIIRMSARISDSPEPEFVYIPTRLLNKTIKNDRTHMMYYDKMHSAVFDNSKAKRDIPEFVTPTRLEETMRKAIAWFDYDPSYKSIDKAANELEDKLCATWRNMESAFETSI